MIKLTNGSTAVSSFNWTNTEQVWPFEKGPDGETLYAKRVQHVISGTSNIFSTGITGITKVIHLDINIGGNGMRVPYANSAAFSWQVELGRFDTSMEVYLGSSWPAYINGQTLNAYAVYSKQP